MKKTFEVVNVLVKDGVIEKYALGGATALLFYAEPSLTFDVDIFVFLPQPRKGGKLVDLGPLYEALASKGYRPEKEHVLIEGIPVQFIPAYKPLVEEAVNHAVIKEYDGVPIRVLTLEYLLAIMIDTHRPKDRERIGLLTGEMGAPPDSRLLQAILTRHSLLDKWRKLHEKK